MLDSALTNHGIVQTERLGQHFAASDIRFSHVFTSDLQRARKTAEAICHAQGSVRPSDGMPHPAPVILARLREQDFGPNEGRSFSARSKEGTRTQSLLDSTQARRGLDGVESRASMAARAESFIDEHLLPCLADTACAKGPVVAVVAHGLILSTLWRCWMSRFARHSIRVGPDSGLPDRALSLEHLGMWSNTGYLEVHLARLEECEPLEAAVPTRSPVSLLARPRTPRGTEDAAKMSPEIQENASMLSSWGMTVRRVNGLDHLKGLKRTRGGVGSSGHDSNQRRMESFFKKRKVA